MVKKVLAIGLNNAHVRQILDEAECEESQITVLVLDEDWSEPALDEVDFDRSRIQYKGIHDYVNHIDPKELYASLGKACLEGAEKISAFIRSNYPDNKFFGISLIDLINQYIRTRHIWPLYQRIYIFTQILRSEKPDEIWICTEPRWYYTIKDPQNIPFGLWLDSRAMEYDAIVKVALSQDIAVRYLRQGLDGWRRYFFTRSIRPRVVKLYKQLHLVYSITRGSVRTSGIESKDTRPLILALIRSPVHKLRLYPVLEELVKQGWRAMVVLDYSLAVQRRYEGVKPEIEEVNLANWRCWRLYRHSKLALRFQQWLMDQQDQLPQIIYHAVEVTDLYVSVISALTGWYAEGAALVDDMTQLMSDIQPDMLLLANDQSASSRALVNLCKQQGVPTLTVQHGLFANPPLPNVPVATDRYAVMGEMAKDLLIQYGTSPAKIAITGIPGWKETPGVQRPGLSKGTGRVTLITQTRLNVSSYFLQAARDMPNVEFVVRPSPRESVSKYENSVPNVSVSQDESLEDVLDRSDLVIGVNSTALYEATLRGIPILVAEMFFQSENPFIPGAKAISRDEDWSQVIRECLWDQDVRQEMVKRQNLHMRYLGLQDGEAENRIVSLIKEMIDG